MRRLSLALIGALAVSGCVAPAQQERIANATPQAAPSSGPKRITYDGAGNFTLPDGTIVVADADGGFTLPNGAHVSPDGSGGVILPNGARCGSDGRQGYICP